MVYLKLTKFEMGEPDETSIADLMRLDAIITDPICSLKQYNCETEQLVNEY